MRKGSKIVFRHDGQLALIIAAMALIFSVVSRAFLTPGNLVSLLENYSVMAIMASGLLVVLISGGIDISFAAVAAVTQYVVALILINAGGNWLVAFALAAAFGGLL
jgi:simple sugar transport system permease protein